MARSLWAVVRCPSRAPCVPGGTRTGAAGVGGPGMWTGGSGGSLPVGAGVGADARIAGLVVGGEALDEGLMLARGRAGGVVRGSCGGA